MTAAQGALKRIADAGAYLAYYSAAADMACTEAANCAALTGDHVDLATRQEAPEYVRDSAIATARVMARGAARAARRATRAAARAAKCADAVKDAAPLACPGREDGYKAHAFADAAGDQARSASAHASRAHGHAVHAADLARTVSKTTGGAAAKSVGGGPK